MECAAVRRDSGEAMDEKHLIDDDEVHESIRETGARSMDSSS